MVTIALDAMGGDNAPDEIIKGALSAVRDLSDIHILLVGREEIVKKKLADSSYSGSNIEIVNATQVIETSDHPANAIRTKKDSSICIGCKLVKEGKADAFVSAGNSGALLVGGTLLVGRVRGVERAPFGTIIPTEDGICLLLDGGANVDVRPSHLVGFAKMGSIYMEKALGIKSPKVGLVNIGTEEEKGNALVLETKPLLEECTDINYIGSIEARDIPSGGADVVICDGFVGNAILKFYEGVSKVFMRMIKKAMKSNPISMIGAAMCAGAIKDELKKFDATRHGGAPLLGLKGLVVKTHGNAKESEIYNAIKQCKTFGEQHIAELIKDKMSTKEE